MAAAFPSVSNLNYRTLSAATSTTEDCIQWLRGLGLLAAHMDCPDCGEDMRELNCLKRIDGKRWRCPDCRKECSIRAGSFFGYGTKLELKTVIDILYHCAYENASFKNLRRECRLGSATAVRTY